MRSNDNTALAGPQHGTDRLWLSPDEGLGTTGYPVGNGTSRDANSGVLLLDKLQQPNTHMMYTKPTERLWYRRALFSLLLIAIAFSPISAQRAVHASGVPTKDHADHGDHEDLLHKFDQVIEFTENQGQFSNGVLYRADFPLGQALATREGMLMKAFDPASVQERHEDGMRIEQEMHEGKPFRPLMWREKGHAWMLHFNNAQPSMKVESRDAHKGTTNYFVGDRSAVDVRSFHEVWYTDVYKATDVRYYPAADGALEYDIICKPGSDPSEIAIEFKGIENVHVSDKGELVLSSSLGDMVFPAPVVYQKINGKEKSVRTTYKQLGKNSIGFNVGAYDRNETLVIDPIALRWATWVNTNSTGQNHGHCIWVDPSDGAIYVVARVDGLTDNITLGAFSTASAGNLEMVVGKYLEPTNVGGLGERVWQTYLGGNGDDNPYAMEQGPDGNLYITGQTSSTNFPLIGGGAFSGSSLNQQAQSGIDVFVLKINTEGNSIKAAVVGGNGADDNFDVRLANNGDVFVSGSTTSTNLLTLNAGSGASNTNNGGSDVFLFRIDQDLSSLVWMRNYGGSSTDRASIMLHNPNTGDLFVGGNTSSTNFPLVSARQSTRGGTTAGFLQRLTGAGTTTWSSYFSSESGDDANLLCMAFNNNNTEIYFGGVTEGLNSANISASGVHDISHNGSNDFYVARMDLDQNFLDGTYIGGSNNETNMMGLNVDQNNDAYVFGYTNSNNFPTSAAPNVPLQTGLQGENDKVFFKLESDLSVLEFSTYFGGTNDDYDPVGERGIKFSNCRIYTIVTSESNNIPLTQGSLNTTKNSGTSTYEPGLVVWANPPDILDNTITSDEIAICAGATPGNITGSAPSYSLPTIIRNGATSSYPNLGSAATYQWQTSTDSLNWTDIVGATGQNLPGTQLGPVNEDTYVRRIIGGDACILAGAADQVVTVRLMTVTGIVTNASCNGFADGTIQANANGLPNFQYAWSNGQTTQTATGLAAGSYSVTVTDASGCTAQQTFQVGQPTVLGGQSTVTPATCANANGGATASGTGGTAPYTYLWSNNTNGPTISGVQGGTYTVTIRDAKNCTVDVIVIIPSTGAVTAYAGPATTITCLTGAEILLNGSGTAGVDFAWSASNGGNIVSGANTATPTVNAAGTYTLTVSNSQSGCSATDAVAVSMNTTAPNATASGAGELTCSVTLLNLDGGSTTPGATFSWSSANGFSSADEDVIVNAAGTYVLTVTNPANGCTNTANVVVTLNNTVPGATAQGGVLNCNVSSIMLVGTGNGTFAWSGPNGFSSTVQNPNV
ncbi:MAG: SBBP repeat-containing protein, partial [Flavobacteriales bacterium]|nr:SBBP repeat-containing protein [Flavobacteriales bacterium]